MSIKITAIEASNLVKEYDSDSFFTVKFVKRTNGEVRLMNCRKGVKKYTKGGALAYKPSDKNLVCVWDAQAKDPERAYRMINLDSILEVKMNGKVYAVE